MKTWQMILQLMRWRPDKAPRQCTFEQIKAPLAEVKL